MMAHTNSSKATVATIIINSSSSTRRLRRTASLSTISMARDTARTLRNRAHTHRPCMNNTAKARSSNKAMAPLTGSMIKATMPTAATLPTHRQRSTNSIPTRTNHTANNSTVTSSSSMATGASNSHKAMISSRANMASLVDPVDPQMASAA